VRLGPNPAGDTGSSKSVHDTPPPGHKPLFDRCHCGRLLSPPIGATARARTSTALSFWGDALDDLPFSNDQRFKQGGQQVPPCDNALGSFRPGPSSRPRTVSNW